MAGFSGGGQFVHRFFYLHPDRLKSLSIGAPGNATYLDQSRPWPLGISDITDRFDGARIELDRLKNVPVQMYIGVADTYHPVKYDGSRGELSRFGVLEKLHHNFVLLGIDPSFEVEPGVEHRGDLLLHLVQLFVLDNIRPPIANGHTNAEHVNGHKPGPTGG